jgi:T5SS/PEP-CTERM-associated repeat protein
MTVTGAGSLWSNRVGRIQLAGDALSTTELNVTDNGQLVHTGDLLLVANTVGANASLNITSGGVVDGRQASNYMSIGNNGTGTVTVAGSGSMLLPCLIKDLYLGNIADSSQGTLIIENGGLVEKMEGAHILRIANRANTTGRLIIREGGLLRWAGGQGHVYVGADKSADTISEMTVTGADSRAILGEFLIAQNGGNALLTVADGGTIELFRTMYLGRISTNSVVSHNGLGQLVVTGPGSVIKKSALTTTELPGASISGTASLGVGGGGFSGWDDNGLKYYGSYGPGGKGLAVIENGGLVDLNGAIGVYSDSTLRIDGGHTQSSTIGLETNSVFNAVLRQEDANGTALMTASGEVRIWGATLAVECGSDFTPVAGDVYTLITAGSLNSTINRFSYDGRVLQDGDLIKSGGTTFKVGYTANSVTLTVHCAGTVILVL